MPSQHERPPSPPPSHRPRNTQEAPQPPAGHPRAHARTQATVKEKPQPRGKEGRKPRSVVPVAPRYIPYFNIILMGFVYLVIVGGVLLMLPLSSAQHRFTSPLTAFFTATSAVSATGLVVVDTRDYWSFWGQLVILVLIQLGGLGYMAITAFLLLLLRHKVNVVDDLVTEAAGVGTQRHFLLFTLSIIIVTLAIEAVGGFFLFVRLRAIGAEDALWNSSFLSVAAFTNAGFDLQGGFASLLGYQREIWVLGAIGGLLLLGAMGVPLLMELLTRRPWARWSLDAKLSVIGVFALVALGAIAIFLVEMGNPATSGFSFPDRVTNAFFLSSASRTAGFTSLNMGMLTVQALMLIMLLMFVGGVSGSTAGGIKVNTFSTLLLTAISYVRGYKRVHAFGRVIPESQVHRAVAIFFLAVGLIFIFTLVLTLTDSKPFTSELFEVVSALTTTGFTVGITPELSAAGQVVLMAAMFIGRLGPLTAVLALTFRHETAPEPGEAEEAIRIG